jgi:hypothetical protein
MRKKSSKERKFIRLVNEKKNVTQKLMATPADLVGTQTMA